MATTRERVAALRARRREAGQCIGCARPSKRRLRCDDCRDLEAMRQKEARAGGPDLRRLQEENARLHRQVELLIEDLCGYADTQDRLAQAQESLKMLREDLAAARGADNVASGMYTLPSPGDHNTGQR